VIPATRIERRKVADLVPADYNPRNISERALAGLSESVRRFGLVQPIIVNERTGNVVGGHQRRKTLVAEGVAETDVVVVDLDVAEERALNVALNNQHISGEFTDDLDAMLEAIAADTPDLFEALRLDDLLDGLVQKVDPADGEDDVPEVPEVPTTITGDLWVMGDHRLLCGDSTSADDVARALDGAEPFIMVTDPPYGVEYDPAWRNEALEGERERVGTVDNDDTSDWREVYALFSGAVAYVWHGYKQSVDVAIGLRECGFELRSFVVWSKPKLAIGRGHYHFQHESAWYAVRKGRPAKWCGDRKQSTIWSIALQSGDEDSATVHGTQKPVECMRRPMLNHGKRGDVVYEPFMGSGSTIIAAETSGRVCRGIDIDARYVDVAVTRWQRFTGGTATLDGDGRTFDEVKEGRDGTQGED
jgi:DNA modification methylase